MSPFFFLLFLPSLTLSLSPSPSPSPSLLQQTCNATTDYEFCLSSLSTSPFASNAATTSSLSSILINLSLSNATNTSSFALALSKTTPNLAPLLIKCANKYMLASDSLRSSLVEVEKENYDYAWVHVGSAKEYPRACRGLFGKGRKYPEEMGRREEVLERLCTVSLDVLNLLINWG